MRRTHLALAVLLAAGLGGCAASDGPPYYTTYPAEPVVVQPQPAAFPSTGPMIDRSCATTAMRMLSRMLPDARRVSFGTEGQ